MSDVDARFTFGSLLVAFGLSYILAHFSTINSFIWTFLGLFLVFEGVYYTVKRVYLKKNDVSGYLSMLFIGISILLFTFNIIQYSFMILLSSFFFSIGLALIISGGLFKIQMREIFSGLTLAGIGIVILIPIVFHISENFYRTFGIYGFGGLFILLGIIIMLPRKGGKKE